jgi:6,7-dimethyl-8-ribityllumazine synthase
MVKTLPRPPVRSHLFALSFIGEMNMRIHIITGAIHRGICQKMVDAAKDLACDLDCEIDRVVWVPGSLEAPLAVLQLIEVDRPDAFIVFGVQQQGKTRHGDVIATQVTSKLLELQLIHRMPMAVSIIGPGATLDHASNKAEATGRKALRAARDMVHFIHQTTHKTVLLIIGAKGAGKSTLREWLEAQGWKSVYVEALYEEFDSARAHTVDKSSEDLRDLVYNTARDRIIKFSKTNNVVFDGTGSSHRFDPFYQSVREACGRVRVVFIDADAELAYTRTQQRNTAAHRPFDRTYFDRIYNDTRARKQQADFVIKNNGTREAFVQKLSGWLKQRNMIPPS